MEEQSNLQEKQIVLAIDVMGADRGVKPLIKGLSDFAKRHSNLRYIIFGRKDEIERALAKFPNIKSNSEIRHCDDVVSMEDKPSQVMRRGKGTSMHAAIEAVKNGEAHTAVSCGNTGALMALSMLVLRKADRIDRPAIAVLWPSSNAQGYNILLDGGADVRADAKDLHLFSILGASFARNLYGLEMPRVGLLNVGTEEGKGRAELAEAYELIEASKDRIGIDFKGFVEGADIASNKVDVIVTDGFTGNVALKTGEGVARYIRQAIQTSFRSNLITRIGAFFAYPALRILTRSVDPRRANGGVFLGLGGTVVKSHGSSDSVAMASAVKMAYALAERDFHVRMNLRLRIALENSEEPLNDNPQ